MVQVSRIYGYLGDLENMGQSCLGDPDPGNADLGNPGDPDPDGLLEVVQMILVIQVVLSWWSR